MRLSILDQSVNAAGRHPAEAIRETLALARAADAFGYHRVWVSEHHGYPGFAGSAPMPLLGAIAARTRRIRLGPAAVLLPHAAPLKVAEEALVLEALAPGRVDLGLGRGPGADQATRYALSPEILDDPMLALKGGGSGFAENVATVIAFLPGAPLPDDHTFGGVSAVPAPEGFGPAPFIVGGTAETARLAGRLGLAYAFAHFVADGAGAAATIAAYRAAFTPSRHLARPHLVVAAFALAAETTDEAARLHGAYRRWRAARDRGAFRPIEPPDARDASAAAGPIAPCFGTPDTVVDDLRTLADELEADEIAIMLPAAHLSVRLDALRLIAGAAGLPAEPDRLPLTAIGPRPRATEPSPELNA